MIELRRQQLLNCGAIRGVGLEIGAYARPTVPPSSCAMRFLDYFSTDELKEQAVKGGYEDVDAILPVDFVVRGEDYRPYVDEKFDFIVANHVLEHIIEPIKWLNMVADLLKEDGVLMITLPDKKYCFDRYRPDTNLSHLVYEFFSPDSKEKKALEHALEVSMYYDFAYIGQKMEIATMLDPERLKREMMSHHPGVHCHVFQGETFLNKILKPIVYMKLIDFSIVSYVPTTPFGEFYFILRKGWAPVALSADEFFTID